MNEHGGYAEGWRIIPSAPDYAVSDLGRVRRETRAARTRAGRMLTPTREPHGYVKVNLDGRTRRVHQLVLEAFVGPRPDCMVTCHNNGNPADNRLSNLRYDTATANSDDRVLHGTANRGERHGGSKLTERDVRAIRALFEDGLTSCDIAAAYGVAPRTVRDIRNHITWSWLDQSGAA